MTTSRRSIQPGFARITAALSDPAREAIVSALADGRAMPAGELAAVAGISPQSASAHLLKRVERRRAMPCEALRQSRTCYCHLAGQLGVSLGDALIRRRLIAVSDRAGYVTAAGLVWCQFEKIAFKPARGPHVRLCNDWNERAPHLAGAFPNAVMKRLVEARCLEARNIPRAMRLTGKGRAFFERLGARIPF